VARVPESFDVLRERGFRLLLSAQGASVLGDRMVAVALAFAVLELGGSASDVGLVLACGAASLVACLLIGGVVADRTSRRAVMVAADLVRVGSQGAMAALLIAGGAEIWMLAALAGVTGAATGFFNPASTGLLPSVVAPERLQQANGLRAAAMSAGEIAGPLVAGVVVAAAGPGWALGADAATFAISAALLARLPRARRDGAAAPRATFLADLRGGWDAFRSRTWVWSFVVSLALGNMVWAAWSALGPVVADRELGGAEAWGTVLAAMGVGALGGSLAATRARPARPLVVVALGGAVFATPLAVLGAGAPVAFVGLAALLAGAAMMVGNALWESTLQRHIPGATLSRVSAYDWFGSLVGYPIGLAVWGPVSEALGIDATLWLAYALLVAGTLAPLAVREVRALPPGPPRKPGEPLTPSPSPPPATPAARP
jgi:MFS family permease